MWFVYCLLCEGDNIYVGITSDLERRFEEHCSGKGARYTRAFSPLQMLCAWEFPDRSQAAKVEYLLKSLSATEKRKIALKGADLSETVGDTVQTLRRVPCANLPS